MRRRAVSAGFEMLLDQSRFAGRQFAIEEWSKLLQAVRAVHFQLALREPASSAFANRSRARARGYATSRWRYASSSHRYTSCCWAKSTVRIRDDALSLDRRVQRAERMINATIVKRRRAHLIRIEYGQLPELVLDVDDEMG